MSKAQITTEKAAEILGVSVRLVQRWVAEGRIKATRPSRSLWLLDAADVRRFARMPRRPGPIAGKSR